MAEQNALAYRDGSSFQSSAGYANPIGLVEYSSAVTCAVAGGVGAPFMRDRMLMQQDVRLPQALTTQSSAVSVLDGKFAPLPNDSRFQANSGRYSKARFITDIAVTGLTSVADDPALTFRGYVRSGGTSGAVGAGESVAYTRPRLADDSRIYAARTSDTGANFIDYSSQVIDNTTGTGVDLVGLAANTSCYFIVGGPAPFCGMAVDMSSVAFNDAAIAAVAYKYWNGVTSAWTTLSNIVDGTISSAIALRTKGQVSWSMPANWTTQTLTSLNLSGYFVQGSVSTAVTTVAGQTKILMEEIDLLFPIRAAVDVQADGDAAMVALESISTGLAGTPAYSGSLWASMR